VSEDTKSPEKLVLSDEDLQPEKLLEIEGKLLKLEVKSIDGIDKQIGNQLKNTMNIENIEDLMNSNPSEIYEKTKMPLNKVIELQKKAQLVNKLVFSEDIIDPLGAQKYTIEQAVEEDPQVIANITGQDMEAITKFIDQLREVTIFLDVATCRKTPITILPKIKMPKYLEYEPPNKFWWIELILIIATCCTATFTVLYALI